MSEWIPVKKELPRSHEPVVWLVMDDDGCWYADLKTALELNDAPSFWCRLPNLSQEHETHD